MKKLAIFMIAILLLGFVAPYNDVAANALLDTEELSKTNTSQVSEEAISQQQDIVPDIDKRKEEPDSIEGNDEADKSTKHESEYIEDSSNINDEDDNQNSDDQNEGKQDIEKEDTNQDSNVEGKEDTNQNSNVQEKEDIDPEESFEEDIEEELIQEEIDEESTEKTEDKKLQKSMMRSFSVAKVDESSTSKLGHLHSGATIYKEIGNEANTISSADYLNAVYYIKKQAVADGQTYYLISTQPSSTNGVVGWVKSSQLSTHDHRTVDKKSKTLYFKGTGSAYSKAWGGSKDVVFKNMSSYTGQKFSVDLTETVGSNTWYRGDFNGKKIWLHSSYVTSVQESSTSKLGHLHTGAVIYEDIDNEATAFSSAGYLNAVYYIKKQAVADGQTYYLISTQPSSTDGVVGWVKSSEMSIHDHKTVDKKAKTLYFKGTGSAYSKAWGGSEDLVFKNMSSYTGQKFSVDLTETVGSNTWYRGDFNGKKIWLHSSYVTTVQESNTSKLGHLHSGATIYEVIGNEATAFSSANYLNAVYYIKKQAVANGHTYYLISTQPSNTNGVIGWVKSSQMSTHEHSTVDKKAKTLYFKGTGSAYSKAWGGSEDVVFKSMSSYTGQKFSVDLTETVGSNTWYRGDFNGKKIWLHSSYVTTAQESSTSKLGHLHSGATIYKEIGNEATVFSSKDYLNAVYYIKKQAVVTGQTYYLISSQPSSSKGIVGWVKSSQMTTHDHKTVDKKEKILYIQGSGNAYNKAWGGSRNLVYNNLSQFEGEEFRVNLTETVGSNTWYRGILGGKTAWIHEAYVAEVSVNETKYNLSLAEAVAIQMAASPQTDKEYDTYVSKSYINSKNEVTASTLNVRGGPNTNYWVVGQLTEGAKVEIIREVNGWYQIKYTENYQWVNASPEDVLYYLDPSNFINDERQRFQFLDLSKPSGSTAAVLNSYLAGKGTLSGQGQAFIEASITNGMSDLYLISHAILETGNGTSALAQGVKYNGVTVYNMFGIGAVDNNALEGGASTAYKNGWTTPYKAIVGGAAFIGNNYLEAGQNTLYEMRWNPAGMDLLNRASHQYATDIGWASKQISTMYNLYQELGLYTININIPVFK